MTFPLALIGWLVIANPAPASAIDLRPSDREQVKLGQQAAAEIRQKYKILPARDPRVVLLRRLGAKLVAQIPETERKRTGFTFTFDLIRHKEVNAFALPGGPIFFYTGLFERFETEDQLAAVMAHEITHVRQKHWATSYADNMKRQFGLAVLFSVFDVNQSLASAITIADDVAFTIPYSRKQETKADDGGYDLMFQAGFSPTAMSQMFKKLGGEKTDWLSSKLSSHPDTSSRIKRAEDRVKQESRPMPAPRRMPPAVMAANAADKIRK